MIEQRARELAKQEYVGGFPYLQTYTADDVMMFRENAFDAGFDACIDSITPYREALRALVEAARALELNLLRREPVASYEVAERANVEANLRKALANAAALLTEGEKENYDRI